MRSLNFHILSSAWPETDVYPPGGRPVRSLYRASTRRRARSGIPSSSSSSSPEEHFSDPMARVLIVWRSVHFVCRMLAPPSLPSFSVTISPAISHFPSSADPSSSTLLHETHHLQLVLLQSLDHILAVDQNETPHLMQLLPEGLGKDEIRYVEVRCCLKIIDNQPRPVCGGLPRLMMNGRKTWRSLRRASRRRAR